MPKTSRKAIIRIFVENNDAIRLKSISEKRGMTQLSLVSRMVKWLANQDAEIQSDVLTTVPNDWSPAKSAKLLKRLAARASDVDAPLHTVSHTTRPANRLR